ncbi:MAG: sugar phosphate isomerase/epimerase [Saprospiraceae bacterium]|nr:sugar phosphate isomerase/epimerase [Saprospiraceae bacterium]
MQLGFVSAILPEFDLRQVLNLAKEIGYDCVEIMCWPEGKSDRRYAGITHIDVDQLNKNRVKEIHQLVNETGVKISGLGYYPNPLTPDRKEALLAINHLKRIIKAAASLELKNINTFVGRDWSKSATDNWPLFLKTWKPLIALAEKNKVKIGIENCPMLFTADEWPGGKNLATTPAIWRKMFADISSDYFGLNYDPSHLIWQHMNYLKPIQEFKNKLFHVHAKDARLDQAQLDEVGVMAHPNTYHTPKLPGLGDVDWGKLFSHLTDAGYRGAVCVEVEDRAYEGSLEDRKRSLVQAHAYLRQYIV